MKKIIFLLFILALITLSVNIVSADDNITAGDIDTLASDINLTSDGDTINLENNYQSDNTALKHIIVDKSITIDGNDYSIDGSGVERVFWVKADNVVIKNLNFNNSKTTGLAGGVISWWGNNGTLINCNFTNNLATSAGGAVLWKGDNGSITNCNFINNTALVGAAVSLCDGDGYDPSQLHIMSVNSDGGALYLSGNDICVNCCSFINNSAEFSGGAITASWGNNVRISNSKFKNNNGGYSGGAVALNGDYAVISNSTFSDNTPQDLFLNSRNSTVSNSYFDSENYSESWYEVEYINNTLTSSFDALSALINNTAEGGVLVLDSDYSYINGSNKGILISKSITIDGNGHTLNGNKLSRMFNITADNVTLKNINFINGNAYGRYYSSNVGGGAIYWSGANGFIENCNFTKNSGSGIEDDPFDKEITYTDENGTVWQVIRTRPMGAKVNEGGAIVWNGTNGTVYKCIFKNNGVGYPNIGGAICWRGDEGSVVESEFYNNDAWNGAAISWIGDNGTVLHSKFINTGSVFGRDIMWFGANGLIRYCFLITTQSGSSLYPYSGNVIADYNFWGDTADNPNATSKISNLSNWVVLNITADREFVYEGENISINCTALIYENGVLSDFSEFNISGSVTAIADKDGFVEVSFKDGQISVEIISKSNIVSKDLTKYFKQSKKFKVRVYGADGKLAVGEYVKFTVNNKEYTRKTDANGYAYLNMDKKPGKYTVTVQYGEVKVKNKITVKTTLITKNLSKKAKKSAKFKVKVLNSKGKAYANKVVKIKFKGKTYKIKSNKKGIATFKIPKNLKAGNYKIKTYYNALVNVNKIIVKK